MEVSEHNNPPPLPEPKTKITELYGYPVEDYSKEELIKALGLLCEQYSMMIRSQEHSLDVALGFA